MTAAHFEDHPTDPDKVILRKPAHESAWNELTFTEVKEAYDKHVQYQIEDISKSGLLDFAIAIERVLKEKNT